jgi:predicted permease
MEIIDNLMARLPVLKGKKNPSLACIIGFLAGALGLAIYFRSIIDLFFLLAVSITLSTMFGFYGYFGGAVLAALYGYFRAQESNQRLGLH